MRKILITLLFLIALNSHSNEINIETIRDIPWNFSGKAGNLFQTENVTFKIKKLLSYESEEVSFGEIIYHDIDGEVIIGESRTLKIMAKHFEVQSYIEKSHINC